MRFPLSAPLRTALLLAYSALSITACSRGDVGAPCDHGSITPPQTTSVSFPATSCNELICIYGDERGADSETCQNDSDCSSDGSERFECNERNQCEIKPDFVLTNSMCSKPCSSDQDCESSGLKKYQYEDTNCRDGFTCRMLQSKGSLCCTKLCVCRDYVDEEASGQLLQDCSPSVNTECPNI